MHQAVLFCLYGARGESFVCNQLNAAGFRPVTDHAFYFGKDIIQFHVGITEIQCAGNFTDLKWVMKGPEVVDGVEQAAVTLNYGNFLQATFDFLIIAFSIFLFIRLLTKLTEKKKEEQTAPAPAPAPSEEVKLLSEIRDLLKKNEE